jgi:hypothetical protein
MTDEEAVKNFAKDPGLVWLINQCESYISIFIVFLQIISSKGNNGWKDDFDFHSSSLSAWPGKESTDGLRAEHLSPDCESIICRFWIYNLNPLSFKRPTCSSR